MMNRISLYKSPYRFPQVKPKTDGNIITIRYDIENAKDQKVLETIIPACKELIFSIQEDKVVFSCIIIHSSEDGEYIEYSYLIDLIPKDNDLVLLSNNTLHLVSIAIIYEIPIIPNSNEFGESLALLYSKAIQFGFNYYEDGAVKNMKFETGKIDILSPIENFKFLNLSRLWSPGEIALLKFDLEFDFERFKNAESTLAMLRSAINELENLLKADTRNENALQNCITQYPILLGLDYGEIKPKHKLGSDYELDYALVKFNGEIDLVEIESANLKLYTKSYNPTKYLVHAEQQIQDWFDWVERNNSYGRDKIPTLISPVGIVIIGRSKDMDEKSAKKLRRRNILYQGRIKILTYDDVLEKAKNILKLLERKSH